MPARSRFHAEAGYLNESPYEKVGKLDDIFWIADDITDLNESPYEKVGKSYPQRPWREIRRCDLNESPYEKVGKFWNEARSGLAAFTSMKVPTKK